MIHRIEACHDLSKLTTLEYNAIAKAKQKVRWKGRRIRRHSIDSSFVKKYFEHREEWK